MKLHSYRRSAPFAATTKREMPRLVRSVLLVLEALVCFGPVGVVLLLGVFFFPFWAMMGAYPGGGDPLLEAAGATPDRIDPPTLVAKDYWGLAWPVLAAIAAAIGFLGLFRWALALRLGRSGTATRVKTALLVGTGIAGWAGFVFFDPWQPDGAEPDLQPWTFFYPMAQVICGLIGVGGVLGMLLVLVQKHPSRAFALISLAACTIGIAALVLFSLPLLDAPLRDILLFPVEAFPAFLVYFVLPTIGTTHFLYLARRTLFLDIYLDAGTAGPGE